MTEAEFVCYAGCGRARRGALSLPCIAEEASSGFNVNCSQARHARFGDPYPRGIESIGHSCHRQHGP